jgi:hypothetical protein
MRFSVVVGLRQVLLCGYLDAAAVLLGIVALYHHSPTSYLDRLHTRCLYF